MLPTISVLLTTIGRFELHFMLESLQTQLNENDNLYIFIDGKECFEGTQKIISKYKFKCNLFVNIENERLGNWGHSLRNKYQKELKGDYILHADDDDIYLKDSFEKIRKYCIYKDKIVFFKFYINYKKNEFVWKTPILKFEDIGTPCGLIPNIPEKFGVWGDKRGGDFEFYNSCKFDKIFVDELIYCVRPRELGSPDEKI